MRKKRKFKFIVLAIIELTLIYFQYKNVSKTIFEIATTDVSAMISTAAYNAVLITLEEQTNYGDLINIERDVNGDVQFIKTNSYMVNKLVSNLANYSVEYLNEYSQKGINVPLGVFSGIKLLSGFGKKVNVKIIDINSCQCLIVSKFEEAGINQTRHSLYVRVNPDISVIVNLKKFTYNQELEILIFDNLIVGKVPDTFLKASVLK